MCRALSLFALLIAIGPAPARAQVTTTGNISVVVTDRAGLLVPGVTVTAAAEDTATTRGAVTDRQGLAELSALHPSARYAALLPVGGLLDIGFGDPGRAHDLPFVSRSRSDCSA